MPLRSVFSIDVEDESFTEFLRTFEKYQDALDKMPGAWGKVNQAVGTARSEFADIAATMLTIHELMERTDKATDQLERHSGGANRFLSGMAREARDIAHHLGDATRSLLRWTGITTAASGLLGFGSVWGLEHLAAGAGNLRRSSSGLGYAPGNAASMQAFQTNLGRLVDPGTFLGGVNTALHDVSQRWTLYAAGMGERQLQGRDTGQVSLELLQNIWREIHRAPPEQLAQVMQARGFDQFLSLQDATRLKQTPYGEIQELIGQTKFDTAGNKIKITDEDLKRWQDFENALRTAGNTLWDTIVKDLAPLAEPLKHLSGGMTEVVDAFLQAPWLKKWIDEAADGLEGFAAYVGTEQFKTDTQEFVRRVGEFATGVKDMIYGMGDFIKWTKANIPASAGVTGPLAGAGIGAWLGAKFGPWGAAIGGLIGAGAGYKATESSRGLSSGEEYALHTLERLGRPLTEREQETVNKLHERQRLHGGASTPPGSSPAAPWTGPHGQAAPSDAAPWTSGPHGQAGSPAPNDALFNWGSIGGGPTTGHPRRYASAGEGVTAVRDLLQEKYSNLSLEDMVKKYAPASDSNDTAQLTNRLSGWMGMRPSEVPNMKDPEVMRRLVHSFIANEHGGAYPKDLAPGEIDQALGFGGKRSDAGGAYGVPGAIMNYGNTGALGRPGTNLVTVTTKGGHQVTLNAAAAPSALAFLNDLEGQGYKIDSLGGFSNRGKAGGSGLSEHAFGTAFDVNPSRNPFRSEKTDLPPGIHDMAAKYGWIWGGDWTSPKDTMHFQWGGPNAGAVAAADRGPSAGAMASADTSGYKGGSVPAAGPTAESGSGMRSGLRLASTAAMPHVSIKVDNQTGGNAGISASQVATP